MQELDATRETLQRVQQERDNAEAVRVENEDSQETMLSDLKQRQQLLDAADTERELLRAQLDDAKHELEALREKMSQSQDKNDPQQVAKQFISRLRPLPGLPDAAHTPRRRAEELPPQLTPAEERHLYELVKDLLEKLRAEDIVLPDNAGQPDVSQTQALRRCRLVWFGTRKINVQFKPCASGEGDELLCRVAGGFMNFGEYARYHGVDEARKLAAKYAKDGGPVSGFKKTQTKPDFK